MTTGERSADEGWSSPAAPERSAGRSPSGWLATGRGSPSSTRGPTRAQRRAEEIGRGTGAEVHAVSGDLADRSRPGCAREAWDALGGAEVLVNAAGIYPSRLLVDMPADEWDACSRSTSGHPWSSPPSTHGAGSPGTARATS